MPRTLVLPGVSREVAVASSSRAVRVATTPGPAAPSVEKEPRLPAAARGLAEHAYGASEGAVGGLRASVQPQEAGV
jgi:hypothetical protein